MTDLREPVNAEAGDYIEDDPAAWEAFAEALRRYGPDLTALHDKFGDDGYSIAAGAILSYLADQHGVFIASSPSSSTED